MALQHLRSGTANKRPLPTAMSDGQLAVNTNLASPGLFFKDSNGDLVKAGPVHVGTTAPNASPASTAATALVANTIYKILTVGTSDFTSVGAGSNAVGVVFTASGTTTGTGTVSGEQGNEKGEQWLDTTNSLYVMKVYDGTGWRVTDSISLANGTAAAPSLHFGSDTNTGLFRSAADSLAITTAGTQRVTVDSSGNVGIGLTTNLAGLCVNSTIRSQNTSSHISYIGFTTYSGSDTVGTMYSYMGGDARNTGYLNFNTNDAERMRIDSSGRLLVGLSSNVDGSNTQINFSATLNRGSNATAADANIGVLKFADLRSNSAYGEIRCQSDGTPGTDDYPGRITFSTTADGAASPTERLRITSAGEVLISNNTNRFLSLDRTNASSGSGEFNLNVESTSQATISYDDGAPLVIGTSSSPRTQSGFTERLKITSGGIVRIPDNGKFTAGAGDDLQIYHDSTDNIIKSATTALKIHAAGSNSYTVHVSARPDKETIICYNNTNAPYVELYYDNSKKLETTSTGVSVTGLLSATTKSFIIDHPTKEGMKLRHGSLEGPENGVYVRGRSCLKAIDLPDYWTALVDPDSITVVLTSIGPSGPPRVERIENNKVYVFSEDPRPLDYFYMINAERIDVEPLEVEISE